MENDSSYDDHFLLLCIHTNHLNWTRIQNNYVKNRSKNIHTRRGRRKETRKRPATRFSHISRVIITAQYTHYGFVIFFSYRIWLKLTLIDPQMVLLCTTSQRWGVSVHEFQRIPVDHFDTCTPTYFNYIPEWAKRNRFFELVLVMRISRTVSRVGNRLLRFYDAKQ